MRCLQNERPLGGTPGGRWFAEHREPSQIILPLYADVRKADYPAMCLGLLLRELVRPTEGAVVGNDCV